MCPQRLAAFAVLCGTLVLNSWVAAELAGLGSSRIENGGALIAIDTPRATAIAKDGVDDVSVAVTGIVETFLPGPREVLPTARIASASNPDPVQNDAQASALPFEVPEIKSILAAFPGLHEMLPPIAPPMLIALASTSDPVQNNVEALAAPVEAVDIGGVWILSPDPHEMLPQATPPVRLLSLFRSAPLEEDLKPAVRVVETPNECLVAEICIDDYLWSFYERTPKVDTNKVKERVKSTVKKKGKTRTVIKTITK